MAVRRFPGSNPFSSQTTCHQEWSFTECLRILCRRKATLLSITALAALGAAIIGATQTRVYQSRASLEIQAFNEDFLNLRDVYPTATSSGDAVLYLQTQIELLQQDSLIEAAARKLRIKGRPEFQAIPASLGKLRQDIRIVPLRNSRIIQVVCDAPDAPLAADLANTLAETFIEQNVESRQRLARQTYESLTLQLAEMRHVLLLPEAREFAQPDPAGTRDLLNPEANANRRFYEAMLQKANDARMASLVRQSNIRLVSAAQPAALPYKPNLPLTLAIGAIGGLIVAFGCVLLYEQNMSALHAPGEAGTYLGLPELGAIPNDRARIQPARGLLTSTVRRPPVDRAVLDQWPSHLSESFRGMLASILAADRHGRLSQTLVVTSSRPMEGKTTVVSNLGIAIAETGSKVLLIDGDGRRPHLHKIFDQANGCGLSDVLREGSAIDELPLDLLVRKTPVPNLYLLPSGAATDNMSGLLHSDRMSQLFTRIRDEFDFVLLDSPPCLEFADARNLARYADGLLFVVRANYTDRKTAQAAVQRLQSDGICITGVILNRWDLSRGDLYGYPAFGGFGRQEVA